MYQHQSPDWIFTPEAGRSSGDYFMRLNRAKRALLAKNILPMTPAWGTEVTFEGEDLGRPPAVREMHGHVLADNMAKNLFRLATAEEIASEQAAQKERERACAAQEAINRKEGTMRFTSAFAEAVKQLGVNPGGK